MDNETRSLDPTIINDNNENTRTSRISNDEVVTIKSTEDERKQQRRARIRRIIVFFSLQLSLFLAALDNTIVATSLPRIGSDFEAMAISSWVVNSYVLTLDAFQPLFSKFSDIFGRKYILVGGILVFLLGSVLCGVSKTMIMLIICRAIQGIGAASIFSMVFVIISDLVPLEKRGSYQGIINAVFAMSSVFGPLIGGSLTDYVSWRWNFYINLPLGGVAVVILIIFLQLPTEKQDLMQKLKRVDYAGNVLVLAAATLFLLAMNFGGQTFPWKSAAVIVCFVLTGVLVTLLVVVEMKYAAEPLLPPRLFKNRSVVSVLLLNVFFGLVFFAVLYYLPIYFQIVRGDSATWSGIRLIPMQMMVCLFSTAAGISISKYAIYRPHMTIGMSLLTLMVGLLCLFDATISFSKIYGITVIGGCGMGLMFSSTIIGLQAAVEPKDIAVVTGLNNFSRVLGGAIGVAIASTILNSTIQKNLGDAIPPQYAAIIYAAPEYIRNGLPEEYMELAINEYVKSLRTVWYVLIGLGVCGVICTLFTKHYSIRRFQAKAPQKKEEQREEKDQETASQHVIEVDAIGADVHQKTKTASNTSKVAVENDEDVSVSDIQPCRQ